MITARQGKEVVVKVTNDIGILHDISKIVAERGVNILAVHGSVAGDKGIVRLITDDNLRACDALKAHNYAPQEADVVLIDSPNKPGMLRSITEKLARESIDVHHLYASGGLDDADSLVVLASASNDHAVVALND